MKKMENIFIIVIITFFVVSIQACLTYKPIVKEENIPVDWGNISSVHTWDNVMGIIQQNVRRYRYFICTHTINENSKESAWDNGIKIVTYTDGEAISMIFNYFAIHFYSTNDSESRYNGIPVRIVSIRSSANDVNSTLDRISMLLERREFNDSEKHLDDLYWLRNLRIRVVSVND
jgi:hypothetical protein